MLLLKGRENGQQFSRKWKDLQPRSAEVEVWMLGCEDGEERGETPMPTCTECLLPAGLAGTVLSGYPASILQAGWEIGTTIPAWELPSQKA